jgi:hypothetical protein
VTFLDFMTPVVRCQRQADVVYFGLSNVFDPVPHNVLLRKLSYLGFSDAYVSLLRSFLTNRHSRNRVSGIHSLPFHINSVLPQGPFIFHLFINNPCKSINHSKFLIFADDLKIFRLINSPHDCLLLQSDVTSVSDCGLLTL